MQPALQQPPAYQHGPPQQQAIVVQQQPVITVQQGSNAVSAENKRGSWCWKGLRVTGYMQTILGVLAVVFGIVGIIIKTGFYYIGVPIWCGICFFIVPGILGIAAGSKKASGLVIGYMVMSILGSVAAFCFMYFTAGVISLDIVFACPDYNYGHFNYDFYYGSQRCSTSSTTRVAIDVCIVLIGLAEFVISIVGASFTYCGLYYNSNPTPQTMVTYQSQPQQMVVGGPPQMYIPSGATVAYPNQVVMQPAQTYQPQGQFQPPPQGLFQPQPQQQVTNPEELIDPNKGDNFYQPLIN